MGFRPHQDLTASPIINLSVIPRTQEARKAWHKVVGTIQADLEGLAKYDPSAIVSAAVGLADQIRLLWWPVGMVVIPDGRLAFRDQGYGEFGTPVEHLAEEGHYGPWICCQAVLQACKKSDS